MSKKPINHRENSPAIRRFLKDKELAQIFGVGLSTLRNQRQLGVGLPYYKFGKTVLYDLEEVMEFIAQRRVEPRETAREGGE